MKTKKNIRQIGDKTVRKQGRQQINIPRFEQYLRMERATLPKLGYPPKLADYTQKIDNKNSQELLTEDPQTWISPRINNLFVERKL